MARQYAEDWLSMCAFPTAVDGSDTWSYSSLLQPYSIATRVIVKDSRCEGQLCVLQTSHESVSARLNL